MAKRILVVDDEVDLTSLLVDLIESFDFWDETPTVDVTSSAKEGLESLETNSYDLIITDHNMPGMCGVEFVQKIKSNADHKLTPCLLMSGHLDSSAYEQLAPFDDVFPVEKPVPMNQLQKHIKDLMKI